MKRELSYFLLGCVLIGCGQGYRFRINTFPNIRHRPFSVESIWPRLQHVTQQSIANMGHDNMLSRASAFMDPFRDIFDDMILGENDDCYSDQLEHDQQLPNQCNEMFGNCEDSGNNDCEINSQRIEKDYEHMPQRENQFMLWKYEQQEKELQMQRENIRRERQRILEQERELEERENYLKQKRRKQNLEEERQRQEEKEFERQNILEKERQRQSERQRQRQILEEERQRQYEMEKQRMLENERWRQKELDRQRIQQRERELEFEKQREMEKNKIEKMKLEKQKKMEREEKIAEQKRMEATKQQKQQSSGKFQKDTRHNRHNSRYASPVVKLDLPGYYPSDLKLYTKDKYLHIIGKHLCSCDEDCLIKEFEKKVVIPDGVDTHSLHGIIDSSGLLVVRGVQYRGIVPPVDTPITVEGHDLPYKNPALSQLRTSCQNDKPTMKLTKMQYNKSTGQLSKEEEPQHSIPQKTIEEEQYDDGITIETVVDDYY